MGAMPESLTTTGVAQLSLPHLEGRLLTQRLAKHMQEVPVRGGTLRDSVFIHRVCPRAVSESRGCNMQQWLEECLKMRTAPLPGTASTAIAGSEFSLPQLLVSLQSAQESGESTVLGAHSAGTKARRGRTLATSQQEEQNAKFYFGAEAEEICAKFNGGKSSRPGILQGRSCKTKHLLLTGCLDCTV